MDYQRNEQGLYVPSGSLPEPVNVRTVNVYSHEQGKVVQWQAPVLVATKLILDTLTEEFNRRLIHVERKVNRLPKLAKSPKAQMWRNIVAQHVQKLELLAGAIDREMAYIERYGN